MNPDDLVKAAAAIGPTVTTVAQGFAAIAATSVVKQMIGPAAAELGERFRDSVRVYRFGRELELLKKAKAMVEDAGFKPQSVPIKLLFPLLEGASLEENETLHTMWAALLANAASPEHAKDIRPGFIAILKQISVDEAIILDWMVSWQQQNGYSSAVPSERIAIAYNERGLGPVDVATVVGPRPVPPNLLTAGLQAFGTCLTSMEANGLIRRVQIHLDDKRSDISFHVTWRGDALIRACRPPQPKK